jgi:epoxide hydrolase 4
LKFVVESPVRREAASPRRTPGPPLSHLEVIAMLAARTLQHRHAKIDGVHLHYVEVGEGAPVLLLHGFPEFWYSWRRQLEPLADAGFRAIALDLRGYNESDSPTGVRNYRASALIADVAGFVQNVCGGSAFLVGHDWGGVLAWRMAALHPSLVRRLAVLNAPHPAAYRDALKRIPSQWFRSWYVLLFQVPWLAEMILRAGNFALLARSLRRQPANCDAFSEAEIAEYKRALVKPGRLTGGLNYYRAALRYASELNAPPQHVDAETLLIWGEQDPFLSIKLLDGMHRWAPRLRIERIPEASHWVQNEAPETVNRALIKFFNQ